MNCRLSHYFPPIYVQKHSHVIPEQSHFLKDIPVAYWSLTGILLWGLLSLRSSCLQCHIWGHPIFPDYRNGCNSPFIQVHIHIWRSQFLLFHLAVFLQVAFFGGGKKATTSSSLRPGVVQYNVYFYWCRGIPCFKPESFLRCCWTLKHTVLYKQFYNNVC